MRSLWRFCSSVIAYNDLTYLLKNQQNSGIAGRVLVNAYQRSYSARLSVKKLPIESIQSRILCTRRSADGRLQTPSVELSSCSVNDCSLYQTAVYLYTKCRIFGLCQPSTV